MNRNEQQARAIMQKAFDDIEALGVRMTQEFGCKISTNSNPSVSSFHFYDEYEEMIQSFPMFAKR